MPPAVTVSDYSDGPPSGWSTWRDRAMPSMSFFSFGWDAFALGQAPDRPAMVRRVAMWTILVSRLLLDLFDWGHYVYSLDIIMVFIQPILALLAFFFVAYCLAHIGQAEGSRTVLSIPANRWHFDAFLALCAVCHAGMVFNYYILLVPGPLISSFRLAWWVLIVGVAWVASWPSEEGISLA